MKRATNSKEALDLIRNAEEGETIILDERTTKFQQRIDELRKGCGRTLDYKTVYDNRCCGDRGGFMGYFILCPTCQAKLEALQEGYKLGLEETESIKGHRDMLIQMSKRLEIELKEANEEIDRLRFVVVGGNAKAYKMARENAFQEAKEEFTADEIELSYKSGYDQAKVETNKKVLELKIKLGLANWEDRTEIIDQVFSNSQQNRENKGDTMSNTPPEAMKSMEVGCVESKTLPADDTQFKQKTDCIWIWDTEDDRKMAEQLEKRVKDQRTKEVIDIIDKFTKKVIDKNEYFIECNDGRQYGGALRVLFPGELKQAILKGEKE